MAGPAPLDLELVPALRRAVDDASLVLHYQPEVDLASGSVVGMEALLRWQHPERGLLWPREFLPVAEAAGLLPDIGRWVLLSCLAEAAEWARLPGRQGSADWQLWMNVSGAQLAAEGFAEDVAELVAATALPRGRLGLEISERSLDLLGDRAVGVLGRLRATGLALAVDDFGTWYSSLGTVGDLPIDAIKLDRSFVRGVGVDLEDDEILASVIRLAHAHGVRVVAEGVESWAEGARLCELGCDRAHGYLFSGPQRPEKARSMLARGFAWRAGAAGGQPTARGEDRTEVSIRPLRGSAP
jgi:EAL domain-containing protein (putative c-di-GMP-specific phosphodiesterase class I)